MHVKCCGARETFCAVQVQILAVSAGYIIEPSAGWDYVTKGKGGLGDTGVVSGDGVLDAMEFAEPEQSANLVSSIGVQLHSICYSFVGRYVDFKTGCTCLLEVGFHDD